LLGPPCKVSERALEAIHGKVYSVFKKLVRKGDKRDALPSRLHPAVINCVAGLSPKCKDEEIEDLVYFILDQYQLSGHLVFLADIDIDEVRF
jgi:separase